MEIIWPWSTSSRKSDAGGGEDGGIDAYYIDHTTAFWPQAAAGLPFSAIEFQSKGDPITDLTENLAAEQKARTVYDNLLRVIREPEVRDPLKFLREREIVHFQRFGEALERTKERLDSQNYYYFNPEFDKQFLKGNCGCGKKVKSGGRAARAAARRKRRARRAVCAGFFSCPAEGIVV